MPERMPNLTPELREWVEERLTCVNCAESTLKYVFNTTLASQMETTTRPTDRPLITMEVKSNPVRFIPSKGVYECQKTSCGWEYPLYRGVPVMLRGLKTQRVEDIENYIFYYGPEDLFGDDVIEIHMGIPIKTAGQFFLDKGINNMVSQPPSLVTPQRGVALDVGCGRNYAPTMLKTDRYLQMTKEEREKGSLPPGDIVCDAAIPGGQPFQDGSFQSVFDLAVLEHVDDKLHPIGGNILVLEKARLLENHGLAFSTQTFLREDHESFANRSLNGLQALYEHTGLFEDSEMKTLGSGYFAPLSWTLWPIYKAIQKGVLRRETLPPLLQDVIVPVLTAVGDVIQYSRTLEQMVYEFEKIPGIKEELARVTEMSKFCGIRKPR